jgi:pSer/pThr/pTyr-binding forkhead associated (FHA) protein
MADAINTSSRSTPRASDEQQLRLMVMAEQDGLAPLSLRVRDTGECLPVTQSEVTVGRHSEADIRLPLPDVSRRHCRLVCFEGKWRIVDLDSLNGVYVNGIRVKQAELAHSDVISIGAYSFDVDMRSHSPTILLPLAKRGKRDLPRAA